VARQREPTGLTTAVTNLWHEHCYVKINWDFSAQFETERCRGTGNFEPGSVLFRD
jgi:hypothetical protein